MFCILLYLASLVQTYGYLWNIHIFMCCTCLYLCVCVCVYIYIYIYIYIHSHLFIHSTADGYLDNFLSGVTMKSTDMSIQVYVPCYTMYVYLLYIKLEMELPDHRFAWVMLQCILSNNFQKWLHQFTPLCAE